MPKRVFIVHGWDGYPEEGWFPWLKKELEFKGLTVIVPQLPDAAYPKIENWVPALAAAVGRADAETYFVGHSLGCQTVARYLEDLPEGQTAGGAVFVAGFFKRLTGLEGPEVAALAEHWLAAPPDFAKVRAHLPQSAAIFSDDDPWVPLDNQDDFREKLGAEIILEHGKGHFSGARDKCFELPAALAKILAITGAA